MSFIDKCCGPRDKSAPKKTSNGGSGGAAPAAADTTAATTAGGKISTHKITRISHKREGVVKRDQERWSVFASGTAQSFPVTNTVDSYLLTLLVGGQKQAFNLILDTGSSNTWVGANTKYTPDSTTAKDTGNTVNVSYGSGSFSGEEYTDTVSLGDTFTISNLSIGVASTATGFTGVDGIVGVGPAGLTAGTTSANTTIPTITDTAASEGIIPAAILGVYFAPPTGQDTQNGEVTFGGVDTSKISGNVTYVPITTQSPASQYWGIDVSSITYGSTSVGSNVAGIVDTGTTLILVSTDLYNSLYGNITGFTVDQNSGLVSIPSDQYANLQDITFVVGGTNFTLTKEQYIVPQNLVTLFGGQAGQYLSVIGDLGQSQGALQFILGQSFLEYYYSVYDTAQGRVGLATRA